MANSIINANSVNPAASMTRVIENTRPVSRPEAAKPEDRSGKTGEAARQPAEQELENVIAVSKDGDTVQASDEAVRELYEEENTGKVIGDPENARTRQTENGSESREELLELELERSAEIRKAQLEAAIEESRERREEAAEISREEPNAVLADEKKTIESEGQISSFIGYSDAELERMYLQGNISKFDYDKEMENREAERENRESELTDFSLEAAGNLAQAERTERAGQEIETAFSEAANEKLPVEDRVKLLMAMDGKTPEPDNDPNSIAPLVNISL